MAQRLQITFAYDPDSMDEAEVDPTTSEGKRAIKDVIVAALEYMRESGEDQLDEQDLAIMDALLRE